MSSTLALITAVGIAAAALPASAATGFREVAEDRRSAGSVGYAVKKGYMKGVGGDKFDPAGFAAREQFAAIIERYDNSFCLAYNEPVLRSHYTENVKKTLAGSPEPRDCDTAAAKSSVLPLYVV